MRWSSFFLTAVFLFVFWLLLSHRFEPLYVISGIICSLIVALLTQSLLFKESISRSAPKKALLFIAYCFYLLYQIVLANLDVVYRVWHPRMPIEPDIVAYKSTLVSDGGKTALANSITLTPGTLTIDIAGGEYRIHALIPKAAGSIESMESFIRRFMR
jgi:multicomponent Na+:H+ antiporter subunit E